MQDRSEARLPSVPLANISERVELYALKSVPSEDPRSVDALKAALTESGVASAWDRKATVRVVDGAQALPESLQFFASAEMKAAREAEKGQLQETKDETKEQARPAATAQGRQAAPEVPEANRLHVYTIGGADNKVSPYFLGKLTRAMNEAGHKKAVLFDDKAQLYFVDDRLAGAAEMAAPFRTDEAKAVNAAFKEARATVQAAEGDRVAGAAAQAAGEMSGEKAKTRQLMPVILPNPRENREQWQAGVNAMHGLARSAKGGDVLRVSAKNLADSERRLGLSGPASGMTAEQKTKLEGLAADWKRGFNKYMEVFASVNGLKRLQEEMAQGVESGKYLDEKTLKEIRASLKTGNQKEATR